MFISCLCLTLQTNINSFRKIQNFVAGENKIQNQSNHASNHQIKNQSFSNGEIIAIWCVFLSLKNYNRKILYFVILLFCYFGGYRKALISASFKLDKATNLK